MAKDKQDEHAIAIFTGQTEAEKKVKTIINRCTTVNTGLNYHRDKEF